MCIRDRLNTTKLYAEFSRHFNADKNHLWNAKTGGYVELFRYDSSWSVTADGVMEVVMDSYNEIAFNPRAIFWEEGLHFNKSISEKIVLQFGYTHRCKHDVDNLEAKLERGLIQERTLVFSGIMSRIFLRPKAYFKIGNFDLIYGLSIRNDFFIQAGDTRSTDDTNSFSKGLPIGALIDAINVYSKFELMPKKSNYSLHFTINYMASLYGKEQGLANRIKSFNKVIQSIPISEIGFNLFNDKGAKFTTFLRSEFQHDAGILPEPTSSRLFLIGFRLSDQITMW